MASVVPKTVGQALYWSYANLAMFAASFQHKEAEYQKIDFIIRHKLYFGLLRGTKKLGSFIDDEKSKLAMAGTCSYCGSQSDLTLDHLIPRLKGGKHSADNLVVACRSCNSSKNARDLLEWMALQGTFPPLVLLRRYLKLAIGYCVDNGLMDVLLEPVNAGETRQPTLFDDLEGDEKAWPTLPFDITLLPFTYPDRAEFRTAMEDDDGS